jgi:hypothetical protein
MNNSCAKRDHGCAHIAQHSIHTMKIKIMNQFVPKNSFLVDIQIVHKKYAVKIKTSMMNLVNTS